MGTRKTFVYVVSILATIASRGDSSISNKDVKQEDLFRFRHHILKEKGISILILK